MDTKLAKELADVVTGHGHSFARTQGIAVSDIPTEFCTLWPMAGPGLKILAGIAKWIPGAGATTGAALGGLIQIGDEISARICK